MSHIRLPNPLRAALVLMVLVLGGCSCGSDIKFTGWINNCGLAYEPVSDLFWAIDWSGGLYTYDPNAGYTRTLITTMSAHDGLTYRAGPLP